MPPSPAPLTSPGAGGPVVAVGGGGGTARLAAARLGTGGAPGPAARAGDAGLEEANPESDNFPRICVTPGGCPDIGDDVRVIPVGVGDPARERLTAGLEGRELGGGDAGEERRERGRGAGDVTREMWLGVVGVIGRGTWCGVGEDD